MAFLSTVILEQHRKNAKIHLIALKTHICALFSQRLESSWNMHSLTLNFVFS